MDITTVEFGKDRYHLNKDMETWCAEYLGKGGWHFDTPKTWAGMGEKVWIINSMFGNTTFAFKDCKDAVLFALRWK
jgi:hypothetical protein